MNNSQSTPDSERDSRRNWHQGKKLFATGLLLMGLTLLDTFGIIRANSRLKDALGINGWRGDGSDGYLALIRFVQAKTDYESVRRDYDAKEPTLKGVSLLREVKRLEAAEEEYKAARNAFLPELSNRGTLNKLDEDQIKRAVAYVGGDKDPTQASVPPAPTALAAAPGNIKPAATTSTVLVAEKKE